MRELCNYVCGRWQPGGEPHRIVTHAVTGAPVARCSTVGVDMAAVLAHGREAGRAVRALTFRERAEALKRLAGALNAHLGELHELAATYGATRRDAWMDVEGGIGALAAYGSLGRKHLPAATFLLDGDMVPLSRDGTFAGQHVRVPREGVAVLINAYNFPVWGFLEKLACAFLAGMPVVVKPATASLPAAHRAVEVILAAAALPVGSLQLLCGGVGDLLDHLTGQDVVAFTGSAATGWAVRSHPNVVRRSVRVNVEADSLNAILLAEDVPPDSPTYEAFLGEVVREMTQKAGQKCTAVRRILVPAAREEAVASALRERLAEVTVGDPAAPGVGMGPLVGREAAALARERLQTLLAEAELVAGDPERRDFPGAGDDGGAFLEPLLLRARDPDRARALHTVEVFGPVATLMAYRTAAHALELCRRGEGSLVASVFTEDEELARRFAFGLAPYHGRVLLLHEPALRSSTGHGAAVPYLVHGGPGRAGGGEELGGLRGLELYLQRTALQGHPERLAALTTSARGEA